MATFLLHSVIIYNQRKIDQIIIPPSIWNLSNIITELYLIILRKKNALISINIDSSSVIGKENTLI